MHSIPLFTYIREPLSFYVQLKQKKEKIDIECGSSSVFTFSNLSRSAGQTPKIDEDQGGPTWLILRECSRDLDILFVENQQGN